MQEFRCGWLFISTVPFQTRWQLMIKVSDSTCQQFPPKIDRNGCYLPNSQVGENWTSPDDVCTIYRCARVDDKKLERVKTVQGCEKNCQPVRLRVIKDFMWNDCLSIGYTYVQEAHINLYFKLQSKYWSIASLLKEMLPRNLGRAQARPKLMKNDRAECCLTQVRQHSGSVIGSASKTVWHWVCYLLECY